MTDNQVDVSAEDRWHESTSNREFYFAEEHISIAISGLPSLRRRILELDFIEGFSPLEIANILGCSVSFVYKQKYAAIKKLRKMLQNGGGVDE